MTTHDFARMSRPNRLRFNPNRFTLCASALLRHANYNHPVKAGSVDVEDIYLMGGDSEIVGLCCRWSDKKREAILAEHGYTEEIFEHEFRSRVRWNYRMHCLLSLMLEA